MRFVPYMLMLLLAWLPWMVLTWPGAMRDDTLAQYLQASGIHQYYTQHPLFDTMVFAMFWNMGAALGSPLIGQALYTVAQVVMLAAGCALLLCVIRKHGAPRWMLALAMIYLATSYVVVGSVTTMGKDSLHTIFFLPAAVIFVEACLTRGAVLARPQVALIFAGLLFAVIASKRTALLIVLCSGCALLAVCGSGRNRRRACACLTLAVMLAQGIWPPIATAVTHANQSSSREIWGYVTQPVAQVVRDHPHALNAEQRQSLDAVMDLDRAAAEISSHRTNETFQTLRTDPRPTMGEQVKALGVWLELGVAYPADYAKAYAGPIRGWWDPSLNFAYPTDSDYLFSRGYLRQWASYLPAGVGQCDGVYVAGVNDADADAYDVGGSVGGDAGGVAGGAGHACGANDDADTVAARRVAAIEHDLRPLMGTSDKPRWRKTALAEIRRWARADNPLTAMALYVTWIPLIVGIALLARWLLARGATIRHRLFPRPTMECSAEYEPAVHHSTVHNVFRHLDRRNQSASGQSAAGQSAFCRPVAILPIPKRLRPGPALAAWSLLLFTVLSLYASPEALFWYPIPVFLSLPLFAALPFMRGGD
jgi:hypothetical protein